MENPPHNFGETKPCVKHIRIKESYKNCKLKVKLRLVGAYKRKKRAIFVLFILSKGNFFKICVLSQCIAY